MVRQGNDKLVTTADFKPVEFYDLGDDPYELNNRVGNPLFNERISILQEQIVEWQKTMGRMREHEAQT